MLLEKLILGRGLANREFTARKISALGIPAFAWIENSALIFVLIATGTLGIVTVFCWHWREGGNLRNRPS